GLGLAPSVRRSRIRPGDLRGVPWIRSPWRWLRRWRIRSPGGRVSRRLRWAVGRPVGGVPRLVRVAWVRFVIWAPGCTRWRRARGVGRRPSVGRLLALLTGERLAEPVELALLLGGELALVGL